MSDLMQTSTQETWLWIGTVGMALGALLILALGRGLGKHSHHAVASFFVCAIAACFYLMMALGQGDVVVVADKLSLTPVGLVEQTDARLVYFARYIDWVFTTPLLLIGLMGVGLAAVTQAGEAVRQRTGLVAGVIGADVLMIVTGLFGALSLDNTNKYIWFVVSCIFFLGVLVVVWGPIRSAAMAQGGAMGELYQKLLVILTVLWFIYPILWILGTEGTETINLNTEVAVFAIIDLLAKVGFGVVLVTGMRKILAGETSASSPAAGQAGSPAA